MYKKRGTLRNFWQRVKNSINTSNLGDETKSNKSVFTRTIKSRMNHLTVK